MKSCECAVKPLASARTEAYKYLKLIYVEKVKHTLTELVKLK